MAVREGFTETLPVFHPAGAFGGAKMLSCIFIEPARVDTQGCVNAAITGCEGAAAPSFSYYYLIVEKVWRVNCYEG